jgi:hypothetical protein
VEQAVAEPLEDKRGQERRREEKKTHDLKALEPRGDWP